MERTLQRWHDKALEMKYLGTVKTMNDFISKLNTNKTQKNLNYKIGKVKHKINHEVITNGTKKHIVYYDPQFVDEFFSADIWNVDATYKCVLTFKKHKLQLLTIMGNRFGKVSFKKCII